MTSILEVDNLTKKYGDFTAVDEISFTVEEGEVFGLLGPNGAGKSTIINMLTGIQPPTSGTARVAGFDITRDMGKAKKVSGLVPQDLAIYPTLSARANLNFFGRIYGLRGSKLNERVNDVLRIVSLEERADDLADTFSGGMKRRLNIAAGLLHQPRLLYLDEPTVGVDLQSRNNIFESVLQLNRDQGMSIIYTSHYMEEVELLCNRVAIIDQGKVIALDTIKNLISLLGGGIIQVGLPQTEVGDDLIAQLRQVPSVKQTTLVVPAAPAEDGEEVASLTSDSVTVKIETENSQEALVNLITFLNERDLSITSLEILEPNLESVFLHLTGKKLRE